MSAESESKTQQRKALVGRLPFSEAEVLGVLKWEAMKRGSQTALAKDIGITEAYLSLILSGHRSVSCKPVLAFMGMRKVVQFVTADAAPDESEVVSEEDEVQP